MELGPDKKAQNLPESDLRARWLLEWYRRHRRDLPWRRTRDPYAIWVSEIMLQQTQVSKVEPFFEAFMKRFPTFVDLAEAPIDDVLAMWTGLGYYRRARFLHRAAQVLVEGKVEIPENAAALERLPGIGPYTAAAIASIAFGEVIPVLDGNVERVICRLLALAEDPKRSEIKKRLLIEAAKLLDTEAPGDSNQALMELGATVCRPRSPACLLCPLSAACSGKDQPELYPPVRKRRASEAITFHVALVEKEGARLFFKRSPTAELMAGMWELPSLETPGKKMATRRAEKELAKRYGGSWTLKATVGEVSHSITYRSITAVIHLAEVDTSAKVASGLEAAWISPGEMGEYAMSSLVGKIIGAVEKYRCGLEESA